MKREDFLKTLTAAGLVGWRFSESVNSRIPGGGMKATGQPGGTDVNMIGAYGPWAAELQGDSPGRYSFRHTSWDDPGEWNEAATVRFSELLARPDTGGSPEVTVEESIHYDGLIIEDISWQLPYGPRSRGYLLRPEDADKPLPGVVALHDHGGNKYFGRRKLVRTGDSIHPMLDPFLDQYYGGRSWANELAKRGYAVLVPDAFAFASRRVLVNDVSERIRGDGMDVSDSEPEDEIRAYNRWASDHEHILSKSLFCAGTTWPGVFVAEDQRALDILAARDGVDESRLGCCGLSGGGLRSLMLSGIDSRIQAAVCTGMMTTWRDYLLNYAFTHTWMIYLPHLPNEMDYSEIFSLQMPTSHRLVLNNRDDQIFDISEQKRADEMLSRVFDKAGLADHYECEFYPGGHKFDESMQEDAFQWFDRVL